MGAATKVRIGEPGREMSAYSVLTIICLFAGNSGGEARASQLLIKAVTGHLPRGSPKSASGKWLVQIKFNHYFGLPDFVFYCRTAYSAELS